MSVKFSVKLEIRAGEKTQERTVDLYEGQIFVLGRETETTLNDGGVSRKHCGLTVEGGALLIIDTGSRNGTFLNDLEITRNSLKEGDHIRIGPYELIVKMITRYESPGRPQPPPVRPSLGLREETQTGSVHIVNPPSAACEGSANWINKLPAPLRSLLASLDFDMASLPAQLKLAGTKPRVFFETTVFGGRTRDSVAVIALAGFLAGIFNSLHFGVSAPLWFPVASVIVYAIVCALISLIRGFLDIEAGFSELMRFSAYQAIVGLPIQMVSAVMPPFAPLLHLALFSWAGFGFFIAFRPRLVRMLALGAVPVLALAVAWFGLIGAVGKSTRVSGEAGDTSGAEKQASTLLPSSETPAQGAAAGTQMRQIVQPHHVSLRNPEPTPAAPEPSENANPFVGEFRLGEVYQYWIQLSGPGFKREAELEVRVKASGHDGATLAVSGGFDKIKTSFDMKVSWEMDFTAPVAFDLQNAGINQIVSLLLSHRVRLSLMGNVPATKLPEALRTGRRMKVAGLKGLYFQNWGPSRSVANVREAFDIAVSKDHALPMFLQGRNDQTSGRIYITLKSYKLPAGL